MGSQIIPFKDVIDIKFNEFYARMVKFASPLGEGWYRIVDYQTTGYILDRAPQEDPAVTMVYGCNNEEFGENANNMARNNPEPLIVHVTQDENGWNHCDPRVYSELYPNDEIYWTWDWGYSWEWQISRGMTGVPERNTMLLGDATLAGAAETLYSEYQPLYTIEPTDPNFPATDRVGPPNQDFNESDPHYPYFMWYRGFIYKRTCTEKNITAPFDWRNVWLARYSTETDAIIWNGGQQYAIGSVVRGSDNWLYVCLLPNQNQDPTLYDAYNQPLANNIGGNSINPWWQNGTPYPTAPPTNAFAPMSMRRAWLRLWPYTYAWFSPWVNVKFDKGNRCQQFFIGRGDYNYGPGFGPTAKNRLTQPIPFRLTPDTLNFVRCLGPDTDSFTGDPRDVKMNTITNNLSNIDFGSRCYAPSKSTITINTEGISGGDKFQELMMGEEAQEAAEINYVRNISSPNGTYRYSYVNDNRIVTFPVSQYYDKTTYWQGEIKNIKFGEGSVGNTFFFVPTNPGARMEMNSGIASIIGQIQFGTPSPNYTIPFTHLAYGCGWRYELLQAENYELGIEPLRWPIFPTEADHGFEPYWDNLHQIETRQSLGFGNVDFGSNFVGNVGFGAFSYTDGNIFPINYSYVDNVYLSQNMDGCFSEVNFKSNNFYNLFLHGVYQTNIGSSVGSVFESVSKFNAKNVSMSFIRDAYSTNLDESIYTSIFHSIALNQTGLIAHSYLDNVVSSKIDNGFWFNTLSFMGRVPNDLKDPNQFGWPFATEDGNLQNNQGIYFQRQGLNIGKHCNWNILKGNVFHTKIDDQFQRNNLAVNYFAFNRYAYIDWSLCDFGKSLVGNNMGGRIRVTEFKDRSINRWTQDPERQRLLPDINTKIVYGSGTYDGRSIPEWRPNEPVIHWMSSDPMPMYWKWGDISFSPSVPGSPYESF
jgi:hypothetical protein